jgi:uncharacterized protein YbjT (DUF2867 family)
MNILLTGANGFIGKYLLGALTAAGHRVTPAVRNPDSANRLLDTPRAIAADFVRDVTPEAWAPRLAGIDAVINCAGILQGSRRQSIDAIHASGPIALFDACARAGVRRVIQISAISAEPGADTGYARSKAAADTYLRGTDLDWVILRPSLVYAEGAYGGTALFRALAALPFMLPLPGKGEGRFAPIHIDDLSAAVLGALDDKAINRVTIDPVGPDTMSLREILIDLRRWLGLAPGRLVEVPQSMIRLAAKLGDIFGGPVNSTALSQMAFGNDGPIESFTPATGIKPRRWRDELLARPAQTQDRWHARLYFIRPLLRVTLALMWLLSGISGLVHLDSMTRLVAPWLGMAGGNVLAISLSVFDLVIAWLVAVRWRTGTMTAVQIAAVLGYAVALSVLDPTLWFAPFGPLIKNLPILAAIATLGAIEPDR